MSLKLILSLALVAVCSATTFHGYDNYHVNMGVGHIIISNDVGHQVHIIINRLTGVDSHLIQIHVTGNGQLLDTEQIVNEPVTLSGQYEADILYKIFTSFNGPLDDVSYEQLLHVVAEHVQDGHVHPAILYALQLLAQQHHKVELLSPYHHEIYNTIQGMFHNIGYNKIPYTGLGSWYGTQRGLGSWYGYGTHQGLGSWYGYGKQYGLGGRFNYPGMWSQNWVHQSYPGIWSQQWARQSYYGPYSSNLYNTVGAGFGHHYWPHSGMWSQWQGGVPFTQQHQLLVN